MGGTPPGPGEFRFPRDARITRADEIRALFRRGKRRKTSSFDVFVSASPVARSRVGVVVAKPGRKSSPGRRRIPAPAARRNRLKRRVREIARTELLPVLGARNLRIDILIRSRPEAYGVEYERLREELIALREWLCSQGS